MYVISDTARYIRKTSIAPSGVYSYDIGRVKWYANVDLSVMFLFACSRLASLFLARFKLPRSRKKTEARRLSPGVNLVQVAGRFAR